MSPAGSTSLTIDPYEDPTQVPPACHPHGRTIELHSTVMQRPLADAFQGAWPPQLCLVSASRRLGTIVYYSQVLPSMPVSLASTNGRFDLLGWCLAERPTVLWYRF